MLSESFSGVLDEVKFNYIKKERKEKENWTEKVSLKIVN